MRIILCKSLLSANSATHNLILLQNYPPLLFSFKCLSTGSKQNQHSYVLSYLINSCGLSPKSALSASKNLNFKTPDKPDKVLNFLKDQGFSKFLIAKLIVGCPRLLLYAYPEKTLLPKIEFFYSKRMSSTDLWKVLSHSPRILALSLKDHIIPYFDFMRSLLGSDDKVIAAIKHYPWTVNRDYQSCIMHNVGILQQYGIPYTNITHALIRHPGALLLRPDRFKELAEEVQLIGVNPLRLSFVIAIKVMGSVRKSTLESKHNALRQLGLLEKDIFSAFVKFPQIMSYSKDKIMAAVDFLVNEMGWESSYIVRYPELVGMSLKKRLIPRCTVIKVLLAKGLISQAISFNRVFYSSEKMFLQRFVNCYEEEAPHLLELYQETLENSN